MKLLNFIVGWFYTASQIHNTSKRLEEKHRSKRNCKKKQKIYIKTQYYEALFIILLRRNIIKYLTSEKSILNLFKLSVITHRCYLLISPILPPLCLFGDAISRLWILNNAKVYVKNRFLIKMQKGISSIVQGFTFIDQTST